MSGLTHQQAKQFVNVAVDHGLTVSDRTALEGHLAECSQCQAYAQEIDQLNNAIGRALRAKWAAPRRSPIDMAARVRHRMNAQAEQKFFLKIANVSVKLGSLAVVMVLAVSVMRGQQISHSNLSSSGSATTSRNDLPRFELEADSNNYTSNINTNTPKADNWELPALPLNRLHASQY